MKEDLTRDYINLQYQVDLLLRLKTHLLSRNNSSTGVNCLRLEEEIREKQLKLFQIKEKMKRG